MKHWSGCWRWLPAVLAALLLPALAPAQEQLLQQLQALPQLQTARVMEKNSRSSQEKIYPLGSVRRISGRLRYTDEVLLRGDQHWLTLQLAPTQDVAEAFSAVRHSLQELAADLLFWCEARDCGPSNIWANNVFGEARLYGPDGGQSYAALALSTDNAMVFVYAVTRGNGRGMLHLEQFVVADLPDLLPTDDTLLRLLRNGETLQLQPVAGSEQQWLRLLQQVMRRSGTMQVEIGGVDARHWYEQLLAAGVSGRSLQLADEQHPGLSLRAVQ